MNHSAGAFGRHALGCDMAREVLRTSGILRLGVTGSSMLPAIWPGDTLMIERIAGDDVSQGDVILFGRGRRFFIHRVVSKSAGDSSILTRGDAMPQPDPPVANRDVLGKVTLILRNAQGNDQRIEPTRSRSFPQRVVSALVSRSDVAARFVLRLRNLSTAMQSSSFANQTSPVKTLFS